KALIVSIAAAALFPNPFTIGSAIVCVGTYIGAKRYAAGKAGEVGAMQEVGDEIVSDFSGGSTFRMQSSIQTVQGIPTFKKDEVLDLPIQMKFRTVNQKDL